MTNPTTLSGAPDTRRDLHPIVENGIARCPECTRSLGNVVGRHLYSAEIILLNRAVFRCRSCNTRLVWVPEER